MSNGTVTTNAPPPALPADGFDARKLDRPAPVLLWYYVIVAALTNVGFPITMPVLFFRYHTLRFKFDDDGISLSWGILFRREIQLTYRRIQDIHVTGNILQRWMGLKNVAIQTASGSTGAEMIIEGVLEADALRDFLYKKMRGARGDDEPTAHVSNQTITAPEDEALVLLRQIRDEIRAIGAARNHPTGGDNEQGR